ncbi:4-hydroxy-tetrahydrodipicolinate reductase [Labilithrix luteola]|uniref:4-hydroxy-tetrahydrodipicolinate reductase n=1 Tax=Labilithrix luteola TaxID=1391654 RepID=A0A0K1PR74_9BACT|nr:4-hydroxy-tetrahydrodipicolinate reductase [Labilithrix luteola]AKU96022.1 4-hydroxy-tetrahydrodipicolinate reductase [Labilithrix luteola]
MSASQVRVAVLGATGRMGRAVTRLAHEGGMKVVCAIGASDEGRDAGELAGVGTLGVPVVKHVSAIAHSGADVVVDFSTPAALAEASVVCAKSKIALVSGTTGLNENALAALADAHNLCAVLWEPNMSVGVHVLSMLVKRAVSALGPSFDIELVETHHRAKVDAPSGTAIRLAEVAREARGGEFVYGREGRPGPRRSEEIGVHAVRGGDVIGDHTVFLFGEGERIELTHRASSRDLFAHGALRAARWLAGRPAGRYTLAEVISSS